MSASSLARFSVSALAVLFTISNASQAGAGECKISAGKLDLTVMFLYDETDFDGWKPVFTEASKLLYNATEGNLQIGTVNFAAACQPIKDKADFWISTGTGGASAHPDGCGKSGWHAFFSNIHKRNDSTAHGQLGMVHELGHYLFNLRDEYGGCVKDPATGAEVPPASGYQWRNSQVSVDGGGEAFFCSQESGGSSCIMDAGTTVTSAFSRTEFCSQDHVGARDLTVTVPAASITDEVQTIENNQECEAGSDCWTLVAQKLGITAPSVPSTTMPSGHTDLVFNDIGAAARFMITIDKSGSMAGDRIVLARSAAKSFVGTARLPRMEGSRTVPGDELGVVAFDSSSTVVSSLAELTSAADKTAVQNAIDGITAGGSTSIGGGLRTSLDQLIAMGSPGCIEAGVLLSDGFHNSGESPASVVPDIVSRGQVIFSIAVGGGADNALLSGIATDTGGKFFLADDSASLPAIFAEIQATVTGAPILERVKRVLEQGASEVFPVLIDESVAVASISISGGGFSSAIVSPSGVRSDSFSQAPGVTYTSDGFIEVFTVDLPETGTWSIEVVRAGLGSGEANLVVTAPSSSIDGPHLQVSAPSSVDFGSQLGGEIRIEAALSEGPGIADALVVAEVLRPDGSTAFIELRDNGDLADGDNSRGDGVYSALFRDFAGNGFYTFAIRADTDGAVLVAGEDGPEPVIVPATAATRSATQVVGVEGLPEFEIATVEYGPETLNLKSRGQFVTAYIELPESLDPAEIDVSSVAITAIDGQSIFPEVMAEPSPTELGDFDGDHTPDLMVKFSRQALIEVLSEGERELRLQGFTVGGQLFVGERTIRVIHPGQASTSSGACGRGYELAALIPLAIVLGRRRRAKGSEVP